MFILERYLALLRKKGFIGILLFPASQHRKFNGERVYHQQKRLPKPEKEPVVSQLFVINSYTPFSEINLNT